MRLRMIPAIYRKEMLDMARDRRTLISMVLVPVLAIPLLFQFIGLFMKMTEARADKAQAKVAVTAADRAPGLLNALAGAQVKFEPSADAKSAVEKKEAAVGVEPVRLADGRLEIRVYADYTQRVSELVSDHVRKAIENFRESSVKIRLKSMGVPLEVYSPFEVTRVNLAKGQKMAGFLWGSMLGYVVILLMFSGGMYPAIDLTAGEKERRTLEVLLSAPAGRVEIMMGKLLATTSAIFLTALLSLGSLAISARYSSFMKSSRASEQLGSLTLALDPATLGLVLAALLPTAVMAAAVMIAIALFAKSFKEAQSYLTPVIMAVIFPLIAGMMPGLQLTPALAAIPLFNVCQLIKEIFQGDFNQLSFAVTVVSNLAFAAIAFFAAVRVFQDERVLFRT